MVLEHLKELNKCKFCGNELIPIGLDYLCANIDPEFIEYERCNCDKAKQYWLEIDSKRQQDERKNQNKALIDDIYRSYNTSHFKMINFENYEVSGENKKSVESLITYTNNIIDKKVNDGLIITGETNSGKTHIAISITHKLIECGQIVLFGRLNTFLDKLREIYNVETKSETQIIDLYSHIEMIIIDDFGTEKMSQWMLDKFYTILCNRCENDLPIIITTRFNKDELLERLMQCGDDKLAEAIVSKLYQKCYGIELKKTKEKVSTSDQTKC